MQNQNDTRQRLEALLADADTEMMTLELNKLLDTELAKPATEIDAELVTRILDLLGVEGPTDQQKQDVWKRIQDTRHRKKRASLPTAMPRRAAILVAALALTALVLWGTAEAFHWPRLFMLAKPADDTFGVELTEQLPLETPTEGAVYTTEDNPDTDFTVYVTLDDVPALDGGYTIIPRWLPDGYFFLAGTLYQDVNVKIYTLTFANGANQFDVVVYVFSDAAVALGFDYERESEIAEAITIGSVEVTLYLNAEDSGALAYWINSEKTQYSISGQLSREEIIRIAEGLQ